MQVLLCVSYTDVYKIIWYEIVIDLSEMIWYFQYGSLPEQKENAEKYRNSEAIKIRFICNFAPKFIDDNIRDR